MWITKEVGKNVRWYSVPDYRLFSNKKRKEVEVKGVGTTFIECFNKWIEMGKPWGYHIFAEQTQTTTVLIPK